MCYLVKSMCFGYLLYICSHDISNLFSIQHKTNIPLTLSYMIQLLILLWVNFSVVSNLLVTRKNFKVYTNIILMILLSLYTNHLEKLNLRYVYSQLCYDIILHLLYMCTYIQLVFQAVDSVIQNMPPNCNLLLALVSVHIAYDSIKAHIQQFHQLASLEPTVVDLLNVNIPYSTSKMVSMLI